MLNIVVAVKQVLDPEAPPSIFKIDPEAKRVIPAAGIPLTMRMLWRLLSGSKIFTRAG